jgi:hypothetical protein
LGAKLRGRGGIMFDILSANESTTLAISAKKKGRGFVARPGPQGEIRNRYGRPVPERACTNETSVLLIKPLTVTSSRKLLVVTACPDCD